MNSKELAYSYKLTESKLKIKIQEYATKNPDDFGWWIMSGYFFIYKVNEKGITIKETESDIVSEITFEELDTLG